jgi:lipopolysaccharide/colanic/teichoic acid biosynthesis glycosyltransferase
VIFKRLFDLIFVIPSLVILLPVFLLVTIWIKIDSSGPVFFRQERVGKFGQIFKVFKFRTMVMNAESLGARVTIGQDPRITHSGSFLRKYKIDELPQLINVLTGEMSLVGPRPEVPEYVSCWPDKLRDIVLSVPPGITDFASIEFRNENNILEGSLNPIEKYVNEIIPIKLEYYVRYVNERSIWLDFKLILKTISLILFKTSRV